MAGYAVYHERYFEWVSEGRMAGESSHGFAGRYPFRSFFLEQGSTQDAVGFFRAVIGCIALLLPLRRANLLAVALAVLILVGIERGNLFQLTRKVLVCVAIVYIVSQCIFLIGIIAMDVSPKQVVMISSTALPEVRDLAVTLSLLHGESLNGTTFEQALIPCPVSPATGAVVTASAPSVTSPLG